MSVLHAPQDSRQESAHEIHAAAFRAVTYLRAHGLRWLSIMPAHSHQRQPSRVPWPVNAEVDAHDVTVILHLEDFRRHFAGARAYSVVSERYTRFQVVEDRIAWMAEERRDGSGPWAGMVTVEGSEVDCG